MKPTFRSYIRSGLVLFHDGFMAALSFVLALYLRLGTNPLEHSVQLVTIGTAVFTLVSMGIFIALKLHRTVWRYTSLPEITQIMRAVTAIVLLFLLVLFLVTRLEAMPRSATAINWLVLVALLAGPRVLFRLIKGRTGRGGTMAQSERIPVLLIGAGDGAELFLRATNSGDNAHYRAVGIVDAKESRIGRHIHGLEVLGNLDALDRVMATLTQKGRRPQRFIVTDPAFSGTDMTALMEKADGFGVTLARLPRITDFRTGQMDKVEPRPIAIEDLLGRAQQVLDRDAMKKLIAGRRVLITGAGGTIGSELARQIADLGPVHLTLVDNSEFALYTVDLEITERAGRLETQAVLGNVGDRQSVENIVEQAKPHIVFHAAALKHVPMVEAQPIEGLLTNAGGTRNIADACRKAGVETMVLISTDKAVNPSSVMGASKRLAESYCQALNLEAQNGGDAKNTTHFVTVRFGNVLGSTGSVVPLFQRQLAHGGPLTVTHADITRYFMTVREAVELVLEASSLRPEDDGANGGICVLDMGEPVKIIDLARQMILLAGLEPDRDIAIEITGLRPGEKLNEELFHEAEKTEPTRYPGVLIARPRALELAEVTKGLDEIFKAANEHDRANALSILSRLVPEYAPPSHGNAATINQKRATP